MKLIFAACILLLLYVSSAFSQPCSALGNETTYGTGNTWIGYVYNTKNFNGYRSYVNEGTAGSPNFDQNFGGGGDNSDYSTNGCSVKTKNFSVRYKLSKTFANGSYLFTVGGDDGYRLSLDGGSTWVINQWSDHLYSTTTYSVSLNGAYNMVLEYYENSGPNRISFSVQTLVLLPVTMQSFFAEKKSRLVTLYWSVSTNSNPRSFEIGKSVNGASFTAIGTVQSNTSHSGADYNFTDNDPLQGTTYYRLKITDRLGTVTYSSTIKWSEGPASVNKINIYPTLVIGNSFFIKSDTNIRNAVITIASLDGKVIAKQNAGNITPQQVVPVSTRTTASGKGVYAIIVTSGNAVLTTRKIIIQ